MTAGNVTLDNMDTLTTYRGQRGLWHVARCQSLEPFMDCETRTWVASDQVREALGECDELEAGKRWADEEREAAERERDALLQAIDFFGRAHTLTHGALEAEAENLLDKRDQVREAIDERRRPPPEVATKLDEALRFDGLGGLHPLVDPRCAYCAPDEPCERHATWVPAEDRGQLDADQAVAIAEARRSRREPLVDDPTGQALQGAAGRVPDTLHQWLCLCGREVSNYEVQPCPDCGAALRDASGRRVAPRGLRRTERLTWSQASRDGREDALDILGRLAREREGRRQADEDCGCSQ